MQFGINNCLLILHEAAYLNDSRPTPEIITNFGNAQDALKETYGAEQSEYQRSAIARKTVDG